MMLNNKGEFYLSVIHCPIFCSLYVDDMPMSICISSARLVVKQASALAALAPEVPTSDSNHTSNDLVPYFRIVLTTLGLLSDLVQSIYR